MQGIVVFYRELHDAAKFEIKIQKLKYKKKMRICKIDK